MSAVKVSVSLESSNLEWLKEFAKQRKETLSGLVGQAVERMRREAAMDEVIAYLGDAAVLREGDAEAIKAEWKD